MFTNVPSEIVSTIIDQPWLIGKGAKLFHHEVLQTLIVEFPSRPHQIVTGYIDRLGDRHCAETSLFDQLSFCVQVQWRTPLTKKNLMPPDIPKHATRKVRTMAQSVSWNRVFWVLARLRADAAWCICSRHTKNLKGLSQHSTNQNTYSLKDLQSGQAGINALCDCLPRPNSMSFLSEGLGCIIW